MMLQQIGCRIVRSLQKRRKSATFALKMTAKQKYLTFFGIIAGGVALDQLTKVIAANSLKSAPAISYLNDFFVFTYAENDGAFLSLGSGLPDFWRLLLLTVLPGLLLIGVMVYMLRSKALTMGENICFALIAAGGIGNIVDRIAYGKVVDFMNMGIGDLRTGIFNVADLYIVFGIVIYAFLYLRQGKKDDAGDPDPHVTATDQPGEAE